MRLKNPETGEERTIEVHGVFVAIGHDPNTTVFKGKLDMDENGYLLATHGSLDEDSGRFVAGDVRTSLSPGGYRGGVRVHGRAGCRKVPGRAQSPRGVLA